jgi:hypothetical protein
MHAENYMYGAIWKHEWINFASSLMQDGSSLLNIQTNLSSAFNIAALSLRTYEKSSLLWFSNLGQYIRKWSSSSTLLELQLEHIRFSTGVIGLVYRPISICSLWLLVRKRVRMFLWLIILISVDSKFAYTLQIRQKIIQWKVSRYTRTRREFPYLL